MNFLSFFDEFPDLTKSEIRNIFITDKSGLKFIPPGNYIFLEMFCPDVNCDCRKAIINIVTAAPFKSWAVLNYGWESEKYYQTWWGKNHALYLPMSGITVDNPTQDPLTQEFIGVFQNITQIDKKYAQRIKKHYFMFRPFYSEMQPGTF